MSSLPSVKKPLLRDDAAAKPGTKNLSLNSAPYFSASFWPNLLAPALAFSTSKGLERSNTLFSPTTVV